MKPTDDLTALSSFMQAEHDRLEQMMVHLQNLLEAWMSEPRASPLQAQALRAVANLATELLNHLGHEEGEGGLEEAACRCPAVAPAVIAAKQEHVELREQVRKLELAVARSAPEALQVFTALKRAIRQHEIAEDKILEQAAGECFRDRVTDVDESLP